MALTAIITIGAVCAGGQHFDATLDFTPGPSVTEAFQKSDLQLAVTDDERRAFIRLLLKLCVVQMPGGVTNAQMKTAVEAKIFDFTVTVI